MSINIMDLVKGAVSDQVMGQLGGMLGQSDTKKTSSMFETATSTILGGLMKKTSTPEGAAEVLNAARDNDDSMLDNLGSMIGGDSQGMLDKGNGMLDMILGGNRGGIMGTLTKMLGLDDSMLGKLMGMAAPIVMSVLGRQVSQSGLDASGLAGLMSSQKEHLGSSMPSQLSGALGIGNMLGSAGDAVKDAAGAVGGAAKNVGGAAADAAGDAAQAGGSLFKFLLPLLVIAALIWGAITYLPGLLSGAADKANDAAAGVASAAGDAASGLQDAAGNVTGVIGDAMPSFEMPKFEGVEFPEGFDVSGMTDQFKGVTDGLSNVTADNVDDVKGKIEGLTNSIDGMGLGDLSGGAKTAVSGMIGNFVKTLQGALGGMEGGILDTLKPVIESLIAKLNPLA